MLIQNEASFVQFNCCITINVLNSLYIRFLQIILTIAEHHSAIVPWQIVAQKTGAILKFVNLTEEEIPDIRELKKMLSKRTKLVVTHHVSNALGMCVLNFLVILLRPSLQIVF